MLEGRLEPPLQRVRPSRACARSACRRVEQNRAAVRPEAVATSVGRKRAHPGPFKKIGVPPIVVTAPEARTGPSSDLNAVAGDLNPAGRPHQLRRRVVHDELELAVRARERPGEVLTVLTVHAVAPSTQSTPFEPLQAYEMLSLAAVNLLPPFGHAGSSPGASVSLVTLTPSWPLTPAVLQLIGMSPGWHSLRPLSPPRR